jgi:hypothetical protein
MTGAELIAAERQRQIEVEGYEPEHDTAHADESLALAACSYAIPWPWRRFKQARVVKDGISQWVPVPTTWPWATWHWKPFALPEGTPAEDHEQQFREGRIRELVKAGALVAAEIDRLQSSQSKVTS